MNLKYFKLYSLRTTNKLRVEDMCDLLGLKSKSNYHKKENGALRFSLKEAKILADLFGLSIEELFFSEDEDNQELQKKLVRGW